MSPEEVLDLEDWRREAPKHGIRASVVGKTLIHPALGRVTVEGWEKDGGQHRVLVRRMFDGEPYRLTHEWVAMAAARQLKESL